LQFLKKKAHYSSECSKKRFLGISVLQILTNVKKKKKAKEKAGNK